jgi:hypothetical protein
LLIFTTKETPAPKPAAETPASGPKPESVTLSNGWKTTGDCILDNADGLRLLKGPSKADSLMTYAMCTDFCFSKGFQVAGVE